MKQDTRQRQFVRLLPQYYFHPLEDLYFDFGLGVRVLCNSDSNYKIKIYDDYTGILHHQFYTQKDKCFYSDKMYYIRWKIEVYKDDKLLYEHLLDLKDKKVIIQFSGKALGDCLAAIESVSQFQIKHQCKLYVFICLQQLIDILKDQYPNITFISTSQELSATCYAYYLLSIGNMFSLNVNTVDFRLVGLEHTFAYLLNVPQEKISKAKLNLSAKRQIKEKYVVISTSASSPLKQYIKQNWIEIVKYLKSLGYIVFQIGLDEQLIDGCENRIGNIHLQKRIDLLKYADMFIGLSSGLSWVANSCNIPVIMICNITVPCHQFFTKYRVQPTIGCRGCIHQITQDIINVCNNKDNPQECKKNITVKQICNTIDQVIKDNI